MKIKSGLTVVALAILAGLFHAGSCFAVTGDQCVPAPSGIGYRPSLFECNGNAAVLLRGNYRNAYSVVVRRFSAAFNDRDPDNTGCGTARCSPYKTQETQEYPDVQVRCLGDNGFSAKFATVTRISIKYTADVQNSLDTSQFQQYCIPDVGASLN